MRQLFTVHDSGLTESALRWGEAHGRWRRVQRGVYAEGPDDPTPLDRAFASVLAAGGVARGTLAGVLHGLDGIVITGPAPRHQAPPIDRIVMIAGIPCANGAQTLADLAAVVDDVTWEQALESALRKGLVSLAELDLVLAEMSAVHARGTGRVRRVLALRPPLAAATESLLETLMVQLARAAPGVPEFVRQHVIHDRYGGFVARLDLSAPRLGMFLELDGQHHKDQPVYDARRETAVVAATGWLPARFTWHEVVHLPNSTRRRLIAVVDQARRRSSVA